MKLSFIEAELKHIESELKGMPKDPEMRSFNQRLYRAQLLSAWATLSMAVAKGCKNIEPGK